jgi:hypothetical protein
LTFDNSVVASPAAEQLGTKYSFELKIASFLFHEVDRSVSSSRGWSFFSATPMFGIHCAPARPQYFISVPKLKAQIKIFLTCQLLSGPIFIQALQHLPACKRSLRAIVAFGGKLTTGEAQPDCLFFSPACSFAATKSDLGWLGPTNGHVNADFCYW